MERFFLRYPRILVGSEKKIGIVTYKAFHIKSCVYKVRACMASLWRISCNSNAVQPRPGCMQPEIAKWRWMGICVSCPFLGHPHEIFIQPVRAAGFDFLGNSINARGNVSNCWIEAVKLEQSIW